MSKSPSGANRVLVLRSCMADGSSSNGFVWPVSGPVEAPDWDPTPMCGHGLHGFLWGEGEASLADWGDDARWLVVAVDSAVIVELGGKVKFPRGEVVYFGTYAGATEYLIENGGQGRDIVVNPYPSLMSLAKPSSPKDSPAIQLLQLVWDKQGHQQGHSWSAINGAMQGALRLAIESHFEFAPNDFAVIASRFSPGYWMGAGDGAGYGEMYYAAACRAGNRSACIAFEKWKGRKPFIIDGKRIYAGYKFKWAGETVTCTSFKDGNAGFVACAYRTEKGKPYTGTYSNDRQVVSKRLTIDAKSLREAKAKKAPKGEPLPREAEPAAV